MTDNMTNTQNMLARDHLKLYLILVNISIIFLFYSIWEIKPVTVDVGDFLGLTSHLSIIYWIGLMLITFCSILIYLDDKLKNETMIIYILMIVGLFLFGLGTFVEDNARARSSYYPIGEIRTVLENGYVDIKSDYPIVSYRNWPAIHFISGFILLFTNIEISNLIKYMPLFWVILFVLATFAIGKRMTSSSSQSFLISFLSISSFWQVYYYYSPQSYGYLSFLFLFMITMFSISFRTKLMTILIFTVSTITHLFYGLISLLVLLSHLLRKKQNKFIFLIMIIFIAWYIYLASLAFGAGVTKIVNTVGSPEYNILLSVDKFTPETGIKAQVDVFRFAYLLIYILFILFCSILYILGKVEKEKREYIKTCIYCLIIISSLGVFSYGSETLERLYMFSIIFVISVIVMTLSNLNKKIFSNLNKKVLVGMMILFIGIHIPAHYGSESFISISTKELKGAKFVEMNANLEQLSKRDNYIYPLNGNRFISYYDPSLITIISRNVNFSESQNILNNTRYVIWGIRNSNEYMYYDGKDPVRQWIIFNDGSLTKIYSNGGLDLYKSLNW